MCRYYLKYSKRRAATTVCSSCRMNSERLKAIPEEPVGDCCMADSDCSHRHGCSSGSAMMRSSAGKSSTMSTSSDDNSGHSEGMQHSPRDAKLRLARQLQAEEHRRRVRDLMESQRIAEEVRQRQEAERRRRAEEARQRDAERRRIVEERKKRLEQADRERRVALLRRLTESSQPEDQQQQQHQERRRGRTGMPFAFGSCTPREVCETVQPAALRS
uniref:CCDC66 domain-containing protein n=1 Tax=Macrostomum lignano TaxID=282301 RepID=A0A1I8G695_9PLAT